MNVTFTPSTLKGVVSAPPSKSMAHRLLICAGLACGQSVVSGIAASKDVLATLDCLEALGARYTYDGDVVRIQGVDLTEKEEAHLPCRECGSTLRFMIPLCLMGAKKRSLSGSETLMNRPLDVYETICRDQGHLFSKEGQTLTVCGQLHSGKYTVRGDISSQFISGLLFTLPLLKGDSEIELLPPVESRSYINMTLSALHAFGIEAEWKDDLTLSVKGEQKYAPRTMHVEGDWSNAAFFDALGILGADVKVTDLDEDSLQGDKVYRAYFEELSRGNATLDIQDCPDLGPILMAVASALHGVTLTGTRRLRIKESDRASAMAEELAKIGGKLIVEENTVIVEKTELYAPSEMIDGHNDHRIVMAMSTLLTTLGGTVRGAQAVQKSFPDYFERLQSLGAKLSIDE